MYIMYMGLALEISTLNALWYCRASWIPVNIGSGNDDTNPLCEPMLTYHVNEKFCILIKISLEFVPKGPIDNKPVLV